MSDCIFCKIAEGQIPASKVYEDELICAFNDISPQAPVHALIIPKAHIADANSITEQTAAVVGHIFAHAGEIAEKLGVAASGYRIISNCGSDAGQTVAHLHFHLLGGKDMGEKLV